MRVNAGKCDRASRRIPSARRIFPVFSKMRFPCGRSLVFSRNTIERELFKCRPMSRVFRFDSNWDIRQSAESYRYPIRVNTERKIAKKIRTVEAIEGRERKKKQGKRNKNYLRVALI